jgi:predicted nucleic acid-binding protein
MKRILMLDTSLSVLFVVGTTKPSYISKHKRLNAFDEIDYKLLCDIIEKCEGIIFTPNVLSETSNLLRRIGEPIKTELMTVFRNIIDSADERTIESKIAAARMEYLRLGLTDAVLLELANSGASLLTVDLDLYIAALSAGYSAANYNHMSASQNSLGSPDRRL